MNTETFAGSRTRHGTNSGWRRHQILGERPPDAATRTRPPTCPWLMGLPAGWVTDVPGVTHAEALKMCGNGVVPAQAALALRICLARIRTEAAA